MNSANLVSLLAKPAISNAKSTAQLDEIISQFPYFQAVRAVQLFHLHKANSFKYNGALKQTAAFTIDRNVLFDFITEPIFVENKSKTILPNEPNAEENIKEINEIHKNISKTLSTSVHNKPLEHIKIAEQDKESNVSEILELGTPISFMHQEVHSFNEWMQLVSKKPIERNQNELKSKPKVEPKSAKFNLIDKFIETNPKIKPIEKNFPNKDISYESTIENENLMTETLAKVYLEQQKYDKAIKAYHILCLKYPEKSGFFADRIKAIKILQKNKS
jgi:hypothetical protein